MKNHTSFRSFLFVIFPILHYSNTPILPQTNKYINNPLSGATQSLALRTRILYLPCLAVFFLTINIFSYGCSVSTPPAYKPATAPEESLSTDVEEDEIYEMPGDHAAYSSGMCVRCHHLTSLSESHQGVHDDECLECHRLSS
jgi:hypothetical protein